MIAAVVPAAGLSRRLGQAKLLLEFESVTLIRRVVCALLDGGVNHVIVVVPPAEVPESGTLQAEAEAAGAEVIVPPTQPAEMRDSIALALEHLSRPEIEAVLLVPADSPGISPRLVFQLIHKSKKARGQIVIPTYEAKRGHPVLFPWKILSRLANLEPGLGLNALVAQNADRVSEFPVSDPDVLHDLDTREDLARWTDRWAERRNPTHANEEIDLMPPDPTRVTVRFFAIARERIGHSEVEIDLPPNATVIDLRRALLDRWPHLGTIWSAAMIAVDEEYAPNDAPITPASLLAVIPPVSGGAKDPAASGIAS